MHRRFFFFLWSSALVVAVLPACSGLPKTPPKVPEPPPEAVQDGQKKPDQKTIYVQIIQKLIDGGQYYAALSYLDKYDHDWPVTPETTFLRATALRKIGCLADAAKLYASLTQGDFKARAYEGLGLIDAEQGDAAAAVRNFRLAARYDPTNAETLNNLGYAALVRKDYALAQDALFKAGQLAPQARKIWSNIAVFQILTGRRPMADKIMERFGLSAQEREMIDRTASSLAAGENAGSSPALPASISTGLAEAGPLQLRITRNLPAGAPGSSPGTQ